jgi:hypothetical protein
MKRRTFIASAAVAATILSAGVASAQEWPIRPINLVVPYNAGGGTDAYARAIAAAARDILRTPRHRSEHAGLRRAERGCAGPERPARRLYDVADLGRVVPFVDVDAGHRYRRTGKLRVRRAGRSAQHLADGAGEQPVPVRAGPDRRRPGRSRRVTLGAFGPRWLSLFRRACFLAENGIAAQDVPFQGGGPTRAALIGEQVGFRLSRRAARGRVRRTTARTRRE